MLAATLALLGTAFAVTRHALRTDDLVLGVIAGTLGFALHQVVDYLVFFPKVGDLWWILLAVASVRVARLIPSLESH
ncbi:MAG: hypothetical protein ACREM6_14370 [Vulcanimicrobiaceae bacterium]